MAISDEFKNHLLDLFADFGQVSVRRMFGGAGVFRDGIMFALVDGDALYFKGDDQNRAFYEAADSEPFVYQARGKAMTMSYFECPADVMDDPETFAVWAGQGFDAALRANAAKPKTRRKR